VFHLNHTLDACFPNLKGDETTFIGSSFSRYGETKPYLNHCIVLGTCDSLSQEKGGGEESEVECIIESYETEREVLLAWTCLMQRENPDIVIGYNIFGFDYEFMFRRAEENHCVGDFLNLSKNIGELCGKFDPKTETISIEESSIFIASGQHDFKYIKMNGRLQIDLYNYFRKEENLPSYKLDAVAGYFIGDYVKKVEEGSGGSWIYSGNLSGLTVHSYIHFEEIGHTTEYYAQGAKFQVLFVDKSKSLFIVRESLHLCQTKKIRWCLAKDDVTPKDIFRLTVGSSSDRAIVAKYCIQDCVLVHQLLNKVDVLTGFIEMSHICSVPINFLVLRGQGIKLTSYVAKKCREKNTLLKVIEKNNLSNQDGYEGAIVLEPKCNLYLDVPVACVDYASLYPSSMISENISHDSKVWSKEYNNSGQLVNEEGESMFGVYLYDDLPEYNYVDIIYDVFTYRRSSPAAALKKIKTGHKVCRFAQFLDGSKAIMPSILVELLSARKRTRKLIPLEKDPFMKNILDKRQLAYKLCANSLYGQCGAKTSTFYEKDIAASTTATGRKLLNYGKKIIEHCYHDRICPTSHPLYPTVLTNAEYIYGDTDSVFFTFNLQDPITKVPIRGKDSLVITIELAQQAGNIASKFLKPPHDLEYEKTFMPFCLLSKKRYVGMLYEKNPDVCKRKEMGIVLKRRDNAPIVKDIYGGIIDILMKQQNIEMAMAFLHDSLQQIVERKCPMEKLIITKSLRSGYKNPLTIAHKVLADRITSRDPGNKPCSGDRIAFVYIETKKKDALQGEKIETPAYILEHKLPIAYSFYITNQIMKPVQQLFALVLEEIWVIRKSTAFSCERYKSAIIAISREDIDESKKMDKIEAYRCKRIKEILFDHFLRETTNVSSRNQPITKFLKRKEK